MEVPHRDRRVARPVRFPTVRTSDRRSSCSKENRPHEWQEGRELHHAANRAYSSEHGRALAHHVRRRRWDIGVGAGPWPGALAEAVFIFHRPVVVRVGPRFSSSNSRSSVPSRKRLRDDSSSSNCSDRSDSVAVRPRPPPCRFWALPGGGRGDHARRQSTLTERAVPADDKLMLPHSPAQICSGAVVPAQAAGRSRPASWPTLTQWLPRAVVRYPCRWRTCRQRTDRRGGRRRWQRTGILTEDPVFAESTSTRASSARGTARLHAALRRAALLAPPRRRSRRRLREPPHRKPPRWPGWLPHFGGTRQAIGRRELHVQKKKKKTRKTCATAWVNFLTCSATRWTKPNHPCTVTLASSREGPPHDTGTKRPAPAIDRRDQAARTASQAKSETPGRCRPARRR